MKYLFFVLLIAITGSNVAAQYPKLIIQLTNKGNNTATFNNAATYLSARAIQRRTRQQINIDSTDLPITQRYIDSIKAAGAVKILSHSRWLNQVLIQSTDAAALSKINQLPFVKSVKGIGFRSPLVQVPARDHFIETIQPVETAATEAQRSLDNALNYGNSFNQVHLHEGEFLHNKGYHGETIQIAVLDAGFKQYKTNTAFDSVRLNNKILGERDFVAFDNSVNEDDLHGANCLSILCANWPGKLVGTAPQAAYWLLRTENPASEYPIEEYNWVVGAEFADSAGADMISSSLGYYDFDDPAFNHSYAQFYKNATTVSMGATLAAKKGMIVMNSAGNEGNNSWKFQIFPADADSVCAVGAVNTAGQIASFSSYGYPGKIKPNIVSVGSGTVLAGLNNQPVTGNGTSYANPNVAGLIACLWQAFPAFKNMQILNAVYKSADRFTTPNDRYGFGIPNFKTAYRLLKKEVNFSIFGNNWLVASPDPFTSKIDATFVGQVDGTTRLELLSPAGQVLFTKNFITEKEEIYNHSFVNLDPFPAGNYVVKYADSLSNRIVNIQKATTSTNTEWLRIVQGTVFTGNVNVLLTAPETTVATLRIMDAKGSTITAQQLNITIGQVSSIDFIINHQPKGIYYLQYLSKTQQRVVRLLKL